jgi:hypothetical protein
VKRGNSDCCAYIAESDANFLNIVKEPVHGEKCVHNCALKDCNNLYVSPYIFCVFYAFLCLGFLRSFINFL